MGTNVTMKDILGKGVGHATVRKVRISPRKMKLVLDLVKGKQLGVALQTVQFSNKKGAKIMKTLLSSATANAMQQAASRIDVDSLWVTAGWVDSGPTLKRFMPRAQGRATPIKKRSSHVTVVLGAK